MAKKNSSMGSFQHFSMSLQKYGSEEVEPCRCCIFSHCVSCSSVCVIRPTTLAAAVKRRPYVYAHTFAPFYFKSFTKLCLSAVRFVLVPFFFRPFKQNTVCCSPVFHYLYFMPFSYGFVR